MSSVETQETIRVQLPDGSVREVASGTTPFDIATSISPRLAAVVVVAKIKPMAGLDINQPEGGTDDAPESAETMYGAGDPQAEKLVDLTTPLTEDVELWLLKEQDEAALKVVRHSAAHVMATAILELFPETKLGHGPATDQGFFYDVYRATPFTEADLAAIEARMAEVVARDEKFVREVEPRELGITQYEEQGEFMKVHFIEKFTKAGDEISLYRNGEFVDFCRGPHVPSTGRVKAFKIMSIAGAYWLGDERNQQLQRIYGTAFFTDKELKAHFARLEEIKARDHRVIGKQLDLFSIQEVAGSGLIFWHPKGGLIRKTMEDWMRVGPRERALPVKSIIFPLAFVFVSVGPNLGRVPVQFIVFDFADELAFVYIYDLYYGAMGDVELRSGGVEGKVVPVALAADLPGFLDVKKLAGNFGGLWSLGRRGKRAGE